MYTMAKKRQKHAQSAPLNTPFGIKNYSHVAPKECPSKEFYSNYTGSDNHVLDILKHLFDPNQWSSNFHETFVHKPQRRRVMRMMVQAGTIDACLRGSYYLTDGTVVRLSRKIMERSSLKTRMYPNDFDFSTPDLKEDQSNNATRSTTGSRATHTASHASSSSSNVARTLSTPSQTSSTTPPAASQYLSSSPHKRAEKDAGKAHELDDKHKKQFYAEQDNIEEEADEDEDDSEGEEQHEEEEELNFEGDEGEEEPNQGGSKEDDIETDEDAVAQLTAKLEGMKLEIKPEDKVLVVEGDSVEVGLWLKKYFFVNPVVLNMASMTHPGGGYRNGSGAQEESLHRRTNLFQCLEDPHRVSKNRDWSYPIPEFGGIYSPNVVVIRSSEEQGYPFKKVPESISFVAVAAYSNPPTETLASGEVVLSKKIAQLTRRKIDTIFKIAIHNGHDCIVLGAFGCGAYCNPASHVAKIFYEALAVYKSYFRIVAFAILDERTSTNPEGNLRAFADGLKCNVCKFRDLPETKDDNDV